jgi:predicted esterase
LPHYLDVTKGRLGDPQLSYGRWAQAVLNTIQYIQSRSAVPDGAIVIIGYSLGASVALCVGAPN